MTRRELLSLPAAALAQSAPKPNFLFLFADDQRFDTVAALGNEDIQTPNLDRLVRSGVSFTHAFNMGGSAPAVCIPSRGMLFSGRSLFRVHDKMIATPPPPDSDRFPLFPETLRSFGYSAFLTGKWHNRRALVSRCFSSGENIFFGGMSDQYKVPVQDYDPSGEFPNNNARIADGNATELFAGSAIRFLKSDHKGRPWLTFCSFTSPHDPRTAPKEFHDLYDPEKIKLPPNFLAEHPFDNGEMKVRDEQLAPWPRTPAVIRRHIADYYAMISHLDAQIGRILQALDETGQAKNTVVIFAGDNGLAVGQHGLMGKQNLYDHSIRIPLVISGPGLPADARRSQPVYLMDLFATICELAGIKPPGSLEGSSLVPFIHEKGREGRQSQFFAYRNVQRAIRTRDRKLIRYEVHGMRTLQLFDIIRDPWERENIAQHRPREIAALTADLERWQRDVADPSLGPS